VHWLRSLAPLFSADLRNELAFFLGDFLQNANKTQISRNKFEDIFREYSVEPHC
jgi:hypothetical protein